MYQYAPGTVLSVMVGPIEHFGIASDWFLGGEQAVLSCSQRRGCMAEEPLSVFAAGAPVNDKGFRSTLASYEVVHRARQLIGKKWNLLTFNCEHAVCEALGLPPASFQLAAFGLLGISLCLVVCCFAARR